MKVNRLINLILFGMLFVMITASAEFKILKGTENMFYISNNGNVGIGTTDPQAKLDVNGNVKIRGNLNVDGIINMGDSEFGNSEFENIKLTSIKNCLLLGTDEEGNVKCAASCRIVSGKGCKSCPNGYKRIEESLAESYLYCYTNIFRTEYDKNQPCEWIHTEWDGVTSRTTVTDLEWTITYCG